MPNNEQTQEEFLKDLDVKPEDTVLETPLTPTPETEEVKETEEEKEEARNRRERRLQSKLTAERESSIALAARLEALTEAQKLRQEEPSEYLKNIERIYGTSTPEAIEATELLKSSLKGLEESATDRALERLREEQRESAQAVDNEEKSLDSMVEQIEDETGQTLDTQTQKGFFALLEKLSPKDSDGNITAYADHHAVWDEFQARKQTQPNPAKAIASRSMTRSGSSADSTLKDDATERFLKENGII